MTPTVDIEDLEVTLPNRGNPYNEEVWRARLIIQECQIPGLCWVCKDRSQAIADLERSLGLRDALPLYDVTCFHGDGSTARMDGLTVNDLAAVVGTFDNLTITRCVIELAP